MFSLAPLLTPAQIEMHIYAQCGKMLQDLITTHYRLQSDKEAMGPKSVWPAAKLVERAASINAALDARALLGRFQSICSAWGWQLEAPVPDWETGTMTCSHVPATRDRFLDSILAGLDEDGADAVLVRKDATGGRLTIHPVELPEAVKRARAADLDGQHHKVKVIRTGDAEEDEKDEGEDK